MLETYLGTEGNAASRRPTVSAQLWGIDQPNVARSDLPAITHVDYSARIQTVCRDTNPNYYDLLKAFEKLTGCGVLVNTSFNVRGESIVCTPADAYRCFIAPTLISRARTVSRRQAFATGVRVVARPSKRGRVAGQHRSRFGNSRLLYTDSSRAGSTAWIALASAISFMTTRIVMAVLYFGIR
jgi:hypothetical protein